MNVMIERDYATIESLESKIKWTKKTIADTYTLIKTTERFEDRYEAEQDKVLL